MLQTVSGDPVQELDGRLAGSRSLLLRTGASAAYRPPDNTWLKIYAWNN